MVVLDTPLVAVTKMPDKQFKGGSVYLGLQLWGIQSIVVRRAWQLEKEANQSHCFLSQQAESSNSLIVSQLSSLCAVWNPNPWSQPYLGWDFSTSHCLIPKIAHRYVQRMRLQGDPVKLTTNVNCHRGKLLELALTLKSTTGSEQWLSMSESSYLP